jgi:hypothetical protein
VVREEAHTEDVNTKVKRKEQKITERSMVRIIMLVWALLLAAGSAGAQAYRHLAEVGAVQEPGFYKIHLPPSVTGHLNPRLGDLRLMDGQGQEVPYFLTREEAVRQQSQFREYEMVRYGSNGRQASTLVLRNPARSPISNISLLIKNADVQKRAQLSGSNDAQAWYIIQDRLLLQSIHNREATAELKLLDFPLSDYEYYRLEINDSASAPLNIVRAGFYDTFTQSGQFTQLSDLTVRQQDSAGVKKTFLTFSSPQLLLLDKLTLDISGPSHYRRQATLYALRQEPDRRGREMTVREPVRQVELSSGKENTVLLPSLRGREWVLEIENQDSPPLQIREARLYQRNTYLVAELQQGQGYRLVFGRPDAAPPAYDLAYFRDQVPAAVPVLHPGPVQPNPALAAPAPEGALSRLLANELVIWSALLLVIGFLAVMSFQMLQEKRG